VNQSRIPNPVAFVLFIGIALTVTNTLTATPGRHIFVLLGGLIATALLAGIVALGLWARTRYRARRSATGD
jgi:hypothetical protein